MTTTPTAVVSVVIAASVATAVSAANAASASGASGRCAPGASPASGGSPLGSSGVKSLDSAVELSRLPSGALVATERVPGVRSVAVGVWVQTGSRDEHPAMLGVSHFLEH